MDIRYNTMNETESVDLSKNKESEFSDVNITAYLLLLSNLKKGELVNDRYEIIEKVGEGGVGFVYKAYDRFLSQTVALKFINPMVTSNSRKLYRIKREVRISREISDPRIVKIFSLENWNDIYFNVMEYIEGESLKSYLLKKKKLKWDEFRPIFFEILKGVKALHEKNIIHRDLKPSNILITKNKKVKIVDFGLSKDLEDETKTSSIGEITGTPYYITPEQVIGEKMGFYSDVYQLGVMLFRVLTGKFPFEEHTSTVELLYKKVSVNYFDNCSEIGTFPDFLSFAIKKAMAVDYRNRFKNINELEKFLLKEKLTIKDRLINSICQNKKVLRRVGVFISFILFLLSFYFVVINKKTVSYLSYKGPLLEGYNTFGIKVFRKDFSPYNVFRAVKLNEKNIERLERLNKIGSSKSEILVFLNHKDYKFFPIRESILSNKRNAKIVFLDNSGNKVFSINNLMNYYSYEFAKNFYFGEFKEFDLGKGKFFGANLKHFLGMYPSAFFLFSENGRAYELYSPGMIFSYRLLKIKNSFPKLLILGKNNIFSHLSYFIPFSLKRGDTSAAYKITIIPQLNPSRETLFNNFIYFFPSHTSFIGAIGINQFKFLSIKTGESMILQISGKKVILTVFNEKKKRVYQDFKPTLKKVLFLVNDFYYAFLKDKDYESAYKIIKEVIKKDVKNPYLRAAFYYLKGLVELKLMDYKNAEKSFQKSVFFYPLNSDAIQKLCEIEFLKGNLKKALDLSEKKYKDIGDFWGLTHVIGKNLFSYYINLQEGKFFNAQEIAKKMNVKDGQKKIMRGVVKLFSGEYLSSLSILSELLGRDPSSFTIAEYRLFFSRSAFTYDILGLSGIKNGKDLVDLASFYVEDLYINSPYKRKFAAMSYAYVLLKRGELEEAIKLAKETMDFLEKEKKTSFRTRLWLFYDSFLYGVIMERIGDKKEALRGYRESIKANPRTQLAKVALSRIRILNS